MNFIIGLCLVSGGFILGMIVNSLLSINRDSYVEKEVNFSKNYLRILFKSVAPQVQPAGNLIGLCMQLDNYLAGQDNKIRELENRIEINEQE